MVLREEVYGLGRCRQCIEEEVVVVALEEGTPRRR